VHVGKAAPHAAAGLHVTGTAPYVDDLPLPARGLHGVLVLSAKPHAELLGLDAGAALALPRVVRVLSAADVPGANAFGVTHVVDEVVFAADRVTCVGQPVGLVLAETHDAAVAGAAAVTVRYGADLPAVLSLEAAIAASAYMPGVPLHRIERGDADALVAAPPAGVATVSGTVRVGAQEHFYLEPHGSVATPLGGGGMAVTASTQAAGKTQDVVATVLGLPASRVRAGVTRLGGGFGGKETRSVYVSAAAAVGAAVTGRAVKIILGRAADMAGSGTRHAFLAHYRSAYADGSVAAVAVGGGASPAVAAPAGRLLAVSVDLYANAGHTSDLSVPVLDRALFHLDNAYDIPAVRFWGRACVTHTPSSTAFRGFGGPQGMLVTECVVDHVARAAGVAPEVVRAVSMYGGPVGGGGVAAAAAVTAPAPVPVPAPADPPPTPLTTPFAMPFDPSSLRSCWTTALDDAGWARRRAAVDAFNSRHRFRKRGLAALPSKFGIAFTFVTYNQAAALLHVAHSDGSVLLSTGGVEMGQGLHTKLAAVAATELGIPPSAVHVEETATDKVANASPTAASASSDMYGMAVRHACRQINARLAPLRAEMAAAAGRSGTTEPLCGAKTATTADAPGGEDPAADGPAAAAVAPPPPRPTASADASAPGGSVPWPTLIAEAYARRTNLSAHGFYRTPRLDAVDLGASDAARRRGSPFFYWTTGAAVAEVELNTLTGAWSARRVDVAMDVGRSLNPALDVGQIEGAFVQGMGWCTMEEVVRGCAPPGGGGGGASLASGAAAATGGATVTATSGGGGNGDGGGVGDRSGGEPALPPHPLGGAHAWVRPGTMTTTGPGTYKIPAARDIPRDFRVRVLDRRCEADTIHSSKVRWGGGACGSGAALRGGQGAAALPCRQVPRVEMWTLTLAGAHPLPFPRLFVSRFPPPLPCARHVARCGVPPLPHRRLASRPSSSLLRSFSRSRTLSTPPGRRRRRPTTRPQRGGGKSGVPPPAVPRRRRRVCPTCASTAPRRSSACGCSAPTRTWRACGRAPVRPPRAPSTRRRTRQTWRSEVAGGGGGGGGDVAAAAPPGAPRGLAWFALVLCLQDALHGQRCLLLGVCGAPLAAAARHSLALGRSRVSRTVRRRLRNWTESCRMNSSINTVIIQLYPSRLYPQWI